MLYTDIIKDSLVLDNICLYLFVKMFFIYFEKGTYSTGKYSLCI